MVRTLAEDGMDVSEARGPFDAVNLFLKRPANLVVLSLDGLRRKDRAFLRELRRISPDLRVLLLVPDGRRPDAMPFLEAGADATLPQPCFPPELKLLARALLRSDAADPLTGLPNRGAYDHALSQELSRAQREKRSLGLALIDVDHFKKVNTEHGYRIGDVVLREVARRLREAFRVTDIVARWGGEEFAVLLSGLPFAAESARAWSADALHRAHGLVSKQAIDIGSGRIARVTVSAGVALYPHDANDRNGLFDCANARLARAKLTRSSIVTSDESAASSPPSQGVAAPPSEIRGGH